jgi:hypothetical protein
MSKDKGRGEPVEDQKTKKWLEVRAKMSIELGISDLGVYRLKNRTTPRTIMNSAQAFD